MPTHLLLITLGVFLAVLFAGLGLSRLARRDEARRLKARLRELARTGEGQELVRPDILQDSSMSAIPAFDLLLRQVPWMERVQRMLTQGDTRLKVGAFLLLSATAGGVGMLLAIFVFRSPYFTLPAFAALASIPWFWAHHRKVKRAQHFERLFPDALDILTSAMRSGLALTGAIDVVAKECAEPVSTEFTILFEETRLGVDMRHSLKNLADRVDSKELHLFVIAVLLQRETGGNLAEVLDGTAAVIRERLRILGDVRAMTAQARLSAGILSVLPVGLAFFILATAPEYMQVLLRENSGRWLLAGAAALQLVGFLIMRRIAQIKV